MKFTADFEANPFRRLHPGIRLLSLLIMLAACSWLDNRLLLPVLAAILLSMGGTARQRWLRLLKRTRWLLLSLLLVLAFSVPGEPLWDAAWSPTQEGLQHAWQQIGHILLALGFIAAFLAATPTALLVEGVAWLSNTLARRNMNNPSRLAVRIALTLHYAETQRPKNWREILTPVQPLADPPPELELPVSRPQYRDWLSLLIVAGLSLGVASIA